MIVPKGHMFQVENALCIALKCTDKGPCTYREACMRSLIPSRSNAEYDRDPEPLKL